MSRPCVCTPTPPPAPFRPGVDCATCWAWHFRPDVRKAWGGNPADVSPEPKAAPPAVESWGCGGCGGQLIEPVEAAAAPSPPAPRPGDPPAGVVVGCYLWPELVSLQCRAVRAACGPVPVLISWDHDPAHAARTDEARRLTAAEGADFLTADAKLGHTAGDAAAYWRGVEWAAARGLAVVAKISQRLVLTAPRWLQDGAADLIASGLPMATRKCVGRWNYPLRTEAALLHVAAWNRPDLLGELRRWRFHDRGPDGYAVEYRLPELLDRLGGVYLPWGLIGDRREARVPGVVWHDSHTRDEYAALAAGFGVELPADFTVAGWGWQLKAGGYSYG